MSNFQQQKNTSLFYNVFIFIKMFSWREICLRSPVMLNIKVRNHLVHLIKWPYIYTVACLIFNSTLPSSVWITFPCFCFWKLLIFIWFILHILLQKQRRNYQNWKLFNSEKRLYLPHNKSDLKGTVVNDACPIFLKLRQTDLLPLNQNFFPFTFKLDFLIFYS